MSLVSQREIFVAPEIRVTDLQSLAECGDARTTLMVDISRIEMQLSEAKSEGAQGRFADGDWFRRANAALKMKKWALQLVQQRRGDISRASNRSYQDGRDKRLIEMFKAMFPDEFDRAVKALEAGEAA